MIHCYEFYASPVISKPRYFELFFHFPWDLEIAGFNCIINFGSTQMDFVFSSSAFTISHLTRQHIYSSKWSVIQLDCKHCSIFYKVIGTIPKRKKKKLAIEYRHLSSFLTNIRTFRRTSTTESIPHSVQT